MSRFSALTKFSLKHSGLSSLPESIPWSASVAEIDLSYNHDLAEIPAKAFADAEGLMHLKLWSAGENMALRENSFYTSSLHLPTLACLFSVDAGISKCCQPHFHCRTSTPPRTSPW